MSAFYLLSGALAFAALVALDLAARIWFGRASRRRKEALERLGEVYGGTVVYRSRWAGGQAEPQALAFTSPTARGNMEVRVEFCLPRGLDSGFQGRDATRIEARLPWLLAEDAAEASGILEPNGSVRWDESALATPRPRLRCEEHVIQLDLPGIMPPSNLKAVHLGIGLVRDIAVKGAAVEARA